MNAVTGTIKPLVKWTGGKYDEYKKFKDYIPSFERYYEPFFGGGGVFFALQPRRNSDLNDVSSDLMQFYTQLPNPQFQKELWQYVKAWEQSGSLARDIGNKLLPIVERYLAGMVRVTTVTRELRSVLETIPYASYTPLFQTSFIINQESYFHQLIRSFKNKCTRLNMVATKEGKLGKDRIVEQIETAVQAAFYAHIIYIHNGYATKTTHDN